MKVRFESLKRFVGGIASVFLRTDQVESDFYTVKIKKDDLQSSLTDMLLEGIIHSKKYATLASL